MGYDRYGRRHGWSRDRGPGDYDRDYGRRPRMTAPPEYDYDERDFFHRAGDEFRSWFGDDEAERRRRYDEYMDRRFGADAMNRHFGGRPGNYGSAPRTTYGGFGTDMGFGMMQPGAYTPRQDERDRYAEDYEAWRERQMAEYDRDYHEFQRERQARFDREFGQWRQKRYQQRLAVGTVKEHQEVVGSDGEHVGKVDYIQGETIVLAKTDKDAGGHHHAIPSTWVENVDDKVILNRTAEEAHDEWRDIEARKAFFENDRAPGDTTLRTRGYGRTYVG